MKNLELTELNDAEQKDHKYAAKKLHNDQANLTFLVEELKRQLAQEQSQSFKKSQIILQFQEIQPQSDASRRQQIQMDSVMTINPRCKVKCAHCGCAWRSRSRDVYTADLLHLSNEKINKLHNEIERQDDNIKIRESDCTRLQMQVNNREDEIDRLKVLLEGGRSVGSLLEDNKLRLAQSRLRELQLQLEISEKNRDQLRIQLDAVKDDHKIEKNRTLKLANENKDLTVELQNAESTNRFLEHDCTSAACALNDKLVHSQSELASCETNLSEQHRLFHMMKKERDQLKENLSMLGQDHSFLLKERQPLLCDNRKMEGVLKRSQEEKKHMIDKVNHLTVHLQESEVVKHNLQEEVTTLHSGVSGLEHQLKSVQSAKEELSKQECETAQVNSRLEVANSQLERKLVKLLEENCRIDDENKIVKAELSETQKEKQSVEQARDYYSDDVNKLSKQLEKLQKEQTTHLQNLDHIQTERNDIEKEKNYYSEQVTQLLHILKTPSSSSKNVIGKKPSEEDIGQLRYDKEVLQQERNYYKMQCQSQKKRVASPPLKQPLRIPPSDRVKMSKPPDADKDVDIEALKSERNFLKDQMNHFQHLYNEAKITKLQQPPPTVVPSITAGDFANKELEMKALRHEVHMQEDEKNFFMEQYERLKTMMAITDSQEESLDAETLLMQTRILEAEKNFYMGKYKDLATKTAQFAMVTEDNRQAGKEELADILAGKRALLLSNAELEAQVDNLQEELKEIRVENMSMAATNKSLSNAVDSLQHTASQKFPPSMQAFIAEIRKNRDAALDELSKTKEERDALRTKFQVVTVQQRKDKVAAQDSIETLQQAQRETDEEAGQLLHRLEAQSVLVASLQQQSNELKGALDEARGELGRTSKHSSKIKKLLESKVGEIGSQEQKIEHRAKQLKVAENSNVQLHTQLADSAQRILQLEEERNSLKENLYNLDKNKNVLNTDLSSKGEIIMALRSECKEKTVNISELKGDISKLERQLQSLEVDLESERRRLSDESERNQRYQQDLAVTTDQKEACNKEIRRLQKEIICLTRDISELQGELEKTRGSRESFKLKAQEYCRTLEELGLNISEKEKEQESLVQQYLSLNETVSSLKSMNASLEVNAVSQNKHITKLDDIVKEAKREREELLEQMNCANNRNSELESTINRLEEEKFNAEKELIGSRDSVQKLETRRSEADSEVQRLSSVLEKILCEKKSTEGDLASVSEQLLSERTAVRSLEELLSEKRKNEFLAESSLKQLQVEKIQLQRKLTELKEQQDEELSENRRLRSRVAQTELELERLRRDISNEQYERERISQQLRRVQKFADMSDALAAVEPLKEIKTSRTAEYATSAGNVASAYSCAGISGDSIALESVSGARSYLDSESYRKIPLNTGIASATNTSASASYHARLSRSAFKNSLSNASSVTTDSVNKPSFSGSFSSETDPSSRQTYLQNVFQHPAANRYPESLSLLQHAERPFYAASIMSLSQAFDVGVTGIVQGGRPPDESAPENSSS